MAVTFIHSSDLQLGKKPSFLGDEEVGVYESDRIASIEALDQLAVERGAAFVVLAGDIFERNTIARTTVNRSFEKLRKVRVPFYLCAGNHDPLTVDSVLAALRDKNYPNIHVIEDATPLVAGEGVEVVGAPYYSMRPSGDIVGEALDQLEPTTDIRVMVGHGQVHGWGGDVDASLISLDRVERKLRDGTIDYLALGDTHSTASLSSTGRVWFSGAPETTDFHRHGFHDKDGGERDSGNALVVTLDKEHVNVEKVALGKWTFDELFFSVHDESDVDYTLATLDAYPDKPRTVLRYGISGAVEMAAYQRLQAGIEEFRYAFAALRLMDVDNPVRIRLDEEAIRNLGVRGYARDVVEVLVSSPSREDRRALDILFELLEEVKQ